MHVTEGSSSTRRVREAGHAFHRRERTQRMEEEGVVPPRCRGARGRRANIEPQPEPEHDVMDVQHQQMEEEEFQEELEAMEEDMENAQP